jgi:all-trans-retinol 13,14-reductase
LEESDDLLPLSVDYVKTSVSDYIDRITTDGVLRNVLVGNLPLYGGERGRTPFYIHAFIHNSYIEGAYRIVGGSQTIANQLTDSIRQMGGEVLKNSEVIGIQGDINQAKRVVLKDGRIIEGSYFISDIHPQQLISLLDEHMVKRSYCRRVRQLENTIGSMTLYIGFKQGKVPYLNSNFFHYNVSDIWSCGNYNEDDWPKGYLFMHQAPVDGGDFSNSALLISYMHFEEVSRWEGTKVAKRGVDYEQFKKCHAERMLVALEKEFPGIRENIAYYNVSTPLTYEDYTATTEGAMYGVTRDVTSPIQTVISQQTYIPNLLMTGQNTNSHGMLGVTNGAMLTCSKLLGLNTIIRDINNAR